jgi:hypothetical protein
VSAARKWEAQGWPLSQIEREYLDAQDVEPGFHDFSSTQVLDAFRAGVRMAREALRGK